MKKKRTLRKESAREKHDNTKRRRRILLIALGFIILLATAGFILRKEIFSYINPSDETTLGSFDKPVNPEQNGRPASDDSSASDAQGLSSENEEDQSSDSRPATSAGGESGGGGDSGGNNDGQTESNAVCGDDVSEENEECDGNDLNDEDCVSLGHDGGNLECTEDCEFDLTSCYRCGDGIKNGDEECDGLALGGETCLSLGFGDGSLSCNESCMFNYSLCYECGNGILESGEICDDNNTDVNDGCNSTCQVESGWECSGEPSSCTPIPPICVDECLYYGEMECSGATGFKTCGNYDGDSCLEWSSTVTNCATDQICLNGACLDTSCTSPEYFCSVGSDYSVRYPAGDVDCNPPDTFCFVTQCTIDGGICTPSFCSEANIPGGDASCEERRNGKDFCCNTTETCIDSLDGILFCNNGGCPGESYYWSGYAWCYGEGYEFCCAMQEPLFAPKQKPTHTLVDIIREFFTRFSFFELGI